MLSIPPDQLATFAASPLGQVTLGVVGSAAWDSIKGGAAALGKLYDRLAHERPDLNERAAKAQATADGEEARRVAREVTNAVLVMAQDGEVELSGATIQALRSVDFDHMRGKITASDFVVFSQGTINLGGQSGSTGSTDLAGGQSGSLVRTTGASIDMGPGTSIKIMGNASIKIT